MKNINAIFKNGNLYDKITRKRIHLKDGVEIVIVGNKKNFLEKDPLNIDIDILEEQEKKTQLLKIQGLLEYKKILEKGNKLFFNIKLTRKDIKKKIKSQFEVELLEDLYVYRKSSWPKDKNQLFDCACKLIGNPSNDIDFFEVIEGFSLNNIYEMTFITYFAKHGSATVNSFKRFYTDKHNPKTTIDNLRYGEYVTFKTVEQLSLY